MADEVSLQHMGEQEPQCIGLFSYVCPKYAPLCRMNEYNQEEKNPCLQEYAIILKECCMW